MKNILYACMAIIALLLSSCSNEDIEITTQVPIVKDAVAVSVSLTNFYQTYDYEDQLHNVAPVQDGYRVFHSESGKYIQVRTLFYDRTTGALCDSVINYVTSINSIAYKADLPEGDYYAITTVAFADKDNAQSGWWRLANKEDLTTAKLTVVHNQSKWSILSESAETFSVEHGKQATVMTTPAPVGALCYTYLQNFQYKDEASYMKNQGASDNGIRNLGLFTQNFAVSYRLNPNAMSKFEYRDDAGQSIWWKVLYLEPDDFKKDWTFFQTNLISYTYILAPEFNFCFGYVYEGENTFNQNGGAKYTVKPGKTYLAYWDWFRVGEPYFGVADNAHWHIYDDRNSNGREFTQKDEFSEF